MKRIAVFASGSGTNAEKIIHYFKNSKSIKIVALMSNNSNSFALERARRNQIPTAVFSNDDFKTGTDIHNLLDHLEVDFIVLAGFLRMIPKILLDAFPNRIINIHPALLPDYGGKGMYGTSVHEKVIRNGEKKSGISIHLVNEFYDEGHILFQAFCPILKNDTAESLAEKIHQLEHEHFPIVIEDWVLNSEEED